MLVGKEAAVACADFDKEKSLFGTFIYGNGDGCIMLPNIHYTYNKKTIPLSDQCCTQTKCFSYSG